MKAVAQASHKRSLADFQSALVEYHKELKEDVIVEAHLGTLYDTMLEQNLCRIIEPYSRVEVSFCFCCVISFENVSQIMDFGFRYHILLSRSNFRCP